MTLDVLSDSVIARVEGGLINAVSRVTTPAGDAFALRVYAELPHASALSRFNREVTLLAALADHVWVPRPVVTDASCTRLDQPFVMYPWIDGMTLNECRREYGSAALHRLAGQLGGMLATIAASRVRLGNADALGRLMVAREVEGACRLLEASVARERLGHDASDALRQLFDDWAARLAEPDGEASLVHGDFGGRNIVVRADADGRWIVAGILDWESATTGSPLWDIGSLFRYARRYSPEFLAEFARGYVGAGGQLPDDWWSRARLVDATRVVTTLNDRRDLGSVFDECREIVRDLIDPGRIASH